MNTKGLSLVGTVEEISPTVAMSVGAGTSATTAGALGLGIGVGLGGVALVGVAAYAAQQ